MKTNKLNAQFLLKSYIQTHIQAIPPKYTYATETGINPAFQAIDEAKCPLQLNEKRLFVLRSDFILAIGIKNAYQEYNYHGLEDILDEEVHQFVNWHDRYGHPSLAVADDRYDGNVLYAGFICQRINGLEIFLSSGRFNRVDRQNEGIKPLSKEQINIIENYLALQFHKAYGTQTVTFYDTLPGKEDDENSLLFFTDKPFPESKKSRSYNSFSLSQAVQLALLDLNYLDAQCYIRRNITPVKPKYSYENEASINPAYQDIEHVDYPLQYLDKRIWVLRSDFILATGVKNAYKTEFGYTGFEDSFSQSVHSFINWKDRYGHPSLTVIDDNYDGSVFYAGYICQRKGYLQVYLASGRFDRKDLTKEQTSILEAYIAAQFQIAYGKQEIVFDYADPDNLLYHTTFFGNGLFPKENPQRRYTSSLIRDILQNIPQQHEQLKTIEETHGSNIQSHHTSANNKDNKTNLITYKLL